MARQVRRKIVLLVGILAVYFSGCAAPHQQVKTIHPQENPYSYNRLQTIALQVIPLLDSEKKERYRIAIIDSREINAYAVDKEHSILVFTLALMEAFDDDELTFILAHEVAHIKLGHYGKKVAASVATTTVFTVANVFLPGVGLLNSLANPLVTRGFSRVQEMDADREAASALRSLALPADVPVRALEKLRTIAQEKGYSKKNRSGLMDTHPSLTDRINQIKNNP